MSKWTSFDEECLADLQGILLQINNTQFNLESLSQRWERMTDRDAERAIEELRKTKDRISGVFDYLEELSEAEDET